jgi:antitoxin MazE
MKVARWGNSLAVRLPAAVVRTLGLREGDNVEMQIAGPRSITVAKTLDVREALARLHKFRGRLPAGFQFNRDEANRRR